MQGDAGSLWLTQKKEVMMDSGVSFYQINQSIQTPLDQYRYDYNSISTDFSRAQRLRIRSSVEPSASVAEWRGTDIQKEIDTAADPTDSPFVTLADHSQSHEDMRNGNSSGQNAPCTVSRIKTIYRENKRFVDPANKLQHCHHRSPMLPTPA